MKKIFTFLTILVSSFFFCSSVKADAQTYSFDASWYSIFDEPLFTYCKNNFDNRVSNGDYNAYFFDYSDYYSTDKHRIYVYAFNGLSSTSINAWSTAPEYSRFNLYFYNSYWHQWSCSDEGYSNSIVNYGSSSLSFYLSFANSEFKAYQFAYFSTSISDYFSFYQWTSRLPFTLNGSNGSSFEFIQNDHLYTLYDLYVNDNTPPTPSDDYPVLTSFYNLVITKLAFITEYIYSSYVLLSIFVILILYFVILLFRRLR